MGSHAHIVPVLVDEATDEDTTDEDDTFAEDDALLDVPLEVMPLDDEDIMLLPVDVDAPSPPWPPTLGTVASSSKAVSRPRAQVTTMAAASNTPGRGNARRTGAL